MGAIPQQQRQRERATHFEQTELCPCPQCSNLSYLTDDIALSSKENVKQKSHFILLAGKEFRLLLLLILYIAKHFRFIERKFLASPKGKRGILSLALNKLRFLCLALPSFFSLLVLVAQLQETDVVSLQYNNEQNS